MLKLPQSKAEDHRNVEDKRGPTLSDLLVDAVDGAEERVTVGQILDKLDHRSFGLAVVLFAIPSIVPMPPGVPTVVGIVLLIVAVQMVAGREELWLPKLLSGRSFPRASIHEAFLKIKPRLEWVERLSKPRLLFLTGAVGARLIGLVILILALVLILPLPPGGNFPPALASAVLGLGLVQRDGIFVLVGYAITVAALVLAILLAELLWDALRAVFSWISGLGTN
jgi:hypothetical protein